MAKKIGTHSTLDKSTPDSVTVSKTSSNNGDTKTSEDTTN